MVVYNLCSYNARGLRNSKKRRKLFAFFTETNMILFFFKRLTPPLMIKIFGRMNGVVKPTLLMVLFLVEGLLFFVSQLFHV